MVKKWVVMTGISIIIGFLLINLFLLPQLGIPIEFLESPFGYALILLTGILIALSGFLPYNWGKILREIAYFSLFVLLILVEINILKPYLKETKVDIDQCKNGIFPTSKSESFFFDALKYASCVFTGYFPLEAGDLGWTVFYIFYLILPFAFIWTIVYALMKDVMSGWNFSINIIRLLSFITAMYAARTMLGGFLLTFLGYGAWGLGAIFISIFLVKGLQKMMESWYVAEEMAVETRKTIEAELDIEKSFAESFKPLISEAKKLANSGPTLLKPAKYKLMEIKNTPQWNALPSSTRSILEEYLNKAYTAGSTSEFLNYVNNIEEFFKSLMKIKK
jgi:hypothetical protein